MPQFYWMIGPDLDNNAVEYKLESQVYGDGKLNINYKEIRLPENAYITINAHGSIKRKKHYLKLDTLSSYTTDVFREISGSNPINVELFSCYGGAAINYICSLAKGSTLITFTSATTPTLCFIDNKIQNTLVNIEYKDNPFIKFLYYLVNYPDTLQFAIHCEDNKSEIFISSIDSLVNFNKKKLSATIIQWQYHQIDSFLEFCFKVKGSMSQQKAEQITTCLNLFNEEGYRAEFIKKANIKQYQDLLVINMSYKGNLQLIKKFHSLGTEFNSYLEGALSPLYVASLAGKNLMVNLLVKLGAPINNYHSRSALDIAIEKGHYNILKTLFKAGASPYIPNKYGDYPLHIATKRGDIKIIHQLAQLAQFRLYLNKRNNSGSSPLDKLCCMNRQPNVY